MAIDLSEGTYISLEDLLLKKVVNNRTLCGNVAYHKYPLYRKNYCGSKEDMEQALVVALMEWAKTKPDPSKLVESEAVKVVEKAWRVEQDRNCNYREEGGKYWGGGLGEDFTGLDENGDPIAWNPADETGEDEDTDNAVLAENSVRWLMVLLGEVPMYVLKAHLLHGLPFDEINRRLKDPTATSGLTDRHHRYAIGYPYHRHPDLTDLDVELIYLNARQQIEDRLADGNRSRVTNYLRSLTESIT